MVKKGKCYHYSQNSGKVLPRVILVSVRVP